MDTRPRYVGHSKNPHAAPVPARRIRYRRGFVQPYQALPSIERQHALIEEMGARASRDGRLR
jgi:hypothetical protein